jgi:biopolymer transport protein ExbB
MNFIVNLLKLYPGLTSGFVQTAVYVGSAFLLFNGLWLIYKAFKQLKRIKKSLLNKEAKTKSSPDDPLCVLTAKTLYTAHKEYKKGTYPQSFLVDATRQLMENLFEVNYLSKITAISNLLPPMGFIGTIFGMIMIFMAKADPNSELNTTGLGVALFTTLAALSCFVVLEALKMRASSLSKQRIESGLNIKIEPEKVVPMMVDSDNKTIAEKKQKTMGKR